MKLFLSSMIATCFICLIYPEFSYPQGSWEKIWGQVDRAILGTDQIKSASILYAVDLSTGDIDAYQGIPLNWKKVGGPGKKFVVADIGHLYGLAPDGSSIWRYDGTPMKWTKIGGPASSIYGGPDALYATNPKTKDIYRYDWVTNKWEKIGGPGKMFAVGNSGHLYGLAPDGSSVWRYDGTPMKWTKIGGPAGSLYAGGDKLYSTTPQTGEIWQYNGAPMKWIEIGGPGKMFAVDCIGQLYGLSPDGSGVWRYDGTPMKWTKIGGAAGSIFAGGRMLCAKNAVTNQLLLYKPDVDLLILAHKDFLEALKLLIKHKNSTGIRTHIESWQSLENRFTGSDSPEKIKKGIATYKKKHHIKWVMLVGDCDRFPVRYLCRDTPDPRGYQANDLYYADLFKSDGSFDKWDGNGNGLYAQVLGTSNNNNNIDKVDWHPDIAVARVPASTIQEVKNYVQKVINYELKVFNAPWFKKALLVTGCDDCGDAVGINDYIAKNYLSGFTIFKHYHTKVWPSYPINQNDISGSMDNRAKPMTDYINDGVGFINYYGHGSWNDFSYVYDKRHLNDLNNKDKLTIIFSRACQTGEFAPSPPWQDYYDVNNVFHAHHNPAPGEIVPTPNPIQPGTGTPHNCDLEARPEDWLVHRNTGAIAYIGCAGTSNPNQADQLDKDFFKAYKLGYTTFGDMWVYMVQQFLDGYGYFDKQGNTIGKNEWERYVIWNALVRFNPFGDPSLRVGGIAGK